MTSKTFTHLSPKHNIPKIERVETDKGRYYKSPSGILLPSITNVLSQFKAKGLQDWINYVGEAESTRIKNVASTRGTKFHNLVEAYLHNKPNILRGAMPDMKIMFRNTKPIIDRIDEIEYIELFLFSEELGAAGTTDVIAKFDGVRSVIDMKSSRKPKKAEYITSYFEQTTAYSIMFEHLTGERINNLVVIVGVDEEESQVFVKDRSEYEASLRKKLEDFHVSN